MRMQYRIHLFHTRALSEFLHTPQESIIKPLQVFFIFYIGLPMMGLSLMAPVNTPAVIKPKKNAVQQELTIPAHIFPVGVWHLVWRRRPFTLLHLSEGRGKGRRRQTNLLLPPRPRLPARSIPPRPHQ